MIRVFLFRNVEKPSDYMIIERFTTIDGPRERVSRHLTGINPEMAMKFFNKAKSAATESTTGVDLSRGSQGIIEFDTGERFWCSIIEPQTGAYMIRYENGWYAPFCRDGSPYEPEPGRKYRTVVAFIPCDGSDPRAAGLPVTVRP